MKANFDIIQEKIKKHKSLNEALRQKKLELDSALEDAKEKRKNFTFYDKADYDREISALNNEREKLKKEISNIKKEIKKVYQEAEKMIFDGISSSYSEIYERQLSRLYGSHVEVIVKKLGDEFDEETCYADGMIVTHDKLQHGKILKMLTFGIKDTDNNYMEKKAHVEFCVYSKAHKVGEIIPYDPEILAKRKIIKIKYKNGEEL